jgi:hypothetical protein
MRSADCSCSSSIRFAHRHKDSRSGLRPPRRSREACERRSGAVNGFLKQGEDTK